MASPAAEPRSASRPGPGGGILIQRSNYLRFHMARLRRKLEDYPAPSPPPADRTGDGLPLSALTSALTCANTRRGGSRSGISCYSSGYGDE